MPYFQFDQSGKVENTGQDTAVSCVNLVTKEYRSILLERKEKQSILRSDRGFFSAKGRYLRVFSIMVTLSFGRLVKRRELNDSVLAVDCEYVGHEKEMRAFVLKYLRKDGTYCIAPSRITFERVGKESAAHRIAIATFRGDAEPSERISAGMLLRLL